VSVDYCHSVDINGDWNVIWNTILLSSPERGKGSG
jgi:hypothetical protein